MTLDEQKKLYVKANKAYVNGSKAIMTDAEFDKLEKVIRKADPEWEALRKTGAKIADKKKEVRLEHFMPSLLKFYPDKIDKWLDKRRAVQSPVMVMDKLDGSSVQLTYENGMPVKLVTRGDGTMGGDISFLIPHLKLPRKIVNKDHLVLRCEALLPTKVFAATYAATFENARNTVNGWLNRKAPHPGLQDVHIVVLGIYGTWMGPGLSLADRLGFHTVNRATVTQLGMIPSLLKVRRAKSKYEMDGLVLCNPNQVLEYEDADKPKWIVAYKENESLEDAATTTVLEVIWQDSAKSRLIPKIRIKPVRLGGTTVTYATCHNAKWMLARGVGPGAKIAIVRSGDVIPKIVGVLKKAKPSLPVVAHKLVGVHFMSIHRSQESDVRALHKFFKTLRIEFIASKTIETLYNAGITTPQQYMKMWAGGDYEALWNAGIGEKMTEKIFAELERVFAPGVSLRNLMVASNCFEAGIGDRKIKAIEKFYKQEPNNVLAHLVKSASRPNQIMADLVQVPGFSDKSAALVANGMPIFVEWLRESLKYIKVAKPSKEKPSAPVSNALKGARVSFTTYRDEVHEQWVIDNGGEVIPFGSKTQVLVYKKGAPSNTKIDKARSLKLKVCTFEDLKKGLK